MEKETTSLNEIGEFGLIKRLSERLKTRQSSSVYGIGDDTAVIKPEPGAIQLMTTDMLVEKVHFDLTYTPLKHLGYKAIAVNVSDIAAMNGIPRQATVAMALSSKFSVEAVEEIYKGIEAACEAFNVDVVGGDTTSSLAGIVLSVTVLGTTTEEKLTRRSTAGVDDLICVTGDLGGAYVGLNILEREKQEFLANPEMQPKLNEHEYVVQRQLMPQARTDVIHQFSELELQPTSMIDISDGLASEILHITTNSEVGAALYEDKLPVDKQTYETAREFDLDPTTCMMNGGEDYELLFTISQDDFDKVKNHPDISVIGHITKKEEGVNLISRKGNVHPITAQGWVHFKS